jgi:hypothetical protein
MKILRMKVRQMRREESARAPSPGPAREIAAIEERIALAAQLLREENPDGAALALDGLLWRMAELLHGEDARMLMRLRLAGRAPDVEARLAHYAALAYDLREMMRAPHAQRCLARHMNVHHRRQGKGYRYDGYRQSA